MRHILTGLESHGIYCSALTSDYYLCIDFEFMAAKGVYLSDLREQAHKYIDVIMDSAKLTLAKGEHANLNHGVLIDGAN